MGRISGKKQPINAQKGFPALQTLRHIAYRMLPIADFLYKSFPANNGLRAVHHQT